MSERTEQVVFLNNCELFLESLSCKARGSYYLVWKKGKKSTQSGKFHFAAEDALAPKELLALSLKLYHLNGAPLPRHTHLLLFNTAGDELARAKLMVEEWSAEPRELAVALGPLTVKAKGKRRAIMRLEKFHRLRSEVEESSEEEGGRFRKKPSSQAPDEREELVRLGKEVEDQGFLIGRLREERTAALLRVQGLEEELAKVEERMRKDLARLREYAQLRMEMRESVYKEEVQHLVTSFNRNYDLNRGLLEGLIKEKYEYEREIEELKESNQEYITHQEANFERIIAEMESHKKEVDEELQDSNEKLKERERTITELNDQLDVLSSELQQLKDATRELQAEKERDFADLSQQIHNQNLKIAEYEDAMEADKLNIQNLTEELQHKETDFVELNRLLEESLTEKTELNKLTLALSEEKEHLLTDNAIMNNELVKLRLEVEEQNDAIGKLKEQYELNTHEIMKQLQAQELAFSKDLENLRNENLLLHARNEEGNNQLQLLKLQLEEAGEREKAKEGEAQLFRKQLETEKDMYEHLLKENAESLDHFKSIQNELNDKLGAFISRNTELELENTQLKGDIRELTVKSSDELDRIRDEYERMMESNKKLFDDENELLRVQREDEAGQFEQIKAEYEQEILSMMEHHKSEIEDLDHLFKEELEGKNRECVELMHRHSKLLEEFEDFRMQAELEKAKLEEDRAKKGRMPRRWAAERINEEDGEDEPIETVEVQSEEDEDEDEEPLIVGKRLKSKKKPSPEPQEERFEELGEEEEREEKSESIVGMFKQKHTKKSKLRKGGKISMNSIEAEEEEEEPKPQQQRGRLKKKPKVEEEIDEEQEEHSSAKKSSEVEKVEGFSEPEPEPQPSQKPKPKPKLQKKVSRKATAKELPFTEQEFEELKTQKQSLEERVDQLERELAAGKKEDRKSRDRFEREERKYQGRIKDLEEELAQLNQEIAGLNAAIGEKDGKAQEIARKQAEARRKEEAQRKEAARELEEQRRGQNQLTVEEAPSPRSVKSKGKKPDHPHSPGADPEQKRKPSPPQRDANERKLLARIEELEETVRQLEQAIREKERRMARLDQQNKELSRQVQRAVAEGLERQQMLESKYLQPERERRHTPGLSSFPPLSADPALKASLANLEEKVSSEREKYQEAKLRLEGKSRECEAAENELRRAKLRIEELEERVKKQTVPRSVQELQGEVDDGNRKILELSRAVNQARLERDSCEDEARLLKKKLAEVGKAGQEWESRAGEAEREAEELRRKEQRWKREGEEWREEEKRLREAVRRGSEELGEARKGQGEFVMERKKVLDEVVRLEGALAQKETENGKLARELEKARGKISEETEGRTGKERELRAEFERLQLQRSKAERKVRELEQTAKLLRQKLQAAEKQARRSLEQRKQSYGEKLRRYIEEITAVKKVIEQYQQENSHLKIQNSEFFEQNEILKMSYEKLEIKAEEMAQHGDALQAENAALQQKAAAAEEAFKRKTEEEAKATALVSAVRKELDNERVSSRKKTEKLQSYEEINERYLYEIKNLKLKLNDYETCAEDAQKLTAEIHASQRTIDSLQEELQKVTEEYQSHSAHYVYTREEVEAALRDLREHELQVKEEEVGRVVAEIDEAHAHGRSNMETELLTLYAENEKLRVALQKATEDAVEFQQQLAEVESLRERSRGLEKERGMLERRGAELCDELQAAREENRRLEVRFNESVRSQEGKATENALLAQKNDELGRRLREVTEGYNELKLEDRRLLEKYKATVDEKDAAIEKLQGEVQAFSNKLLADELEIRRLKEMEKMSTDDAVKKIRKLESRIEELTATHQHSLRELQSRSKAQIKELKNTITRYEQQLEDKLHRIQELNEGVLMLQSEVEELTAELTAARGQLAEEGELYTLEINKLRNSMREMETAYDENLRSLEEELSAMNKELTALKFSREAGNSRLRGSRQSESGEDRAGRRLEEKLKLKDRRIEELKETVLVLEQKLAAQLRAAEAKGGETAAVGAAVGAGVGADQLRAKIGELQKEHREAIEKKEAELSKLCEELKRAKEELLRLTSREEQLALALEEKDFELQACAAELAMVSRLYNDLQREVEGRKEGLGLQLRSDAAIKMELEAKAREIACKGELLAAAEGRCAELEAAIKKKIAESRTLSQQVEELSKERSELMSAERRKLQGESLAKLRLKQLQKEAETARGENRKLRNELALALKESDGLKGDLMQKNAALADLLREVQANDRKIEQSQQLIEKYIALNELGLAQLQTPLEGLLPLCKELRGQAEARGEELALLTEEHEELKFLYERKFLDLEEAKRENYELVLRVQERELNFQELDALHERVVSLQQENKHLAFRLEALRVQLQGVYTQGGPEGQVMERIREILADRYV